MEIQEVYEGLLEASEKAPEPISQECSDKSYFEAYIRFFQTCDEYISMNTWKNVWAISSYALKGIQIIQFTYLFCVLLMNSIKKKGSIGCLPIIVCFAAISNAVFEVNHTYLINQDNGFFEQNKATTTFTFIYANSCYLALLLFGSKYFEVSLLVGKMLVIEDKVTYETNEAEI